MRTTFFSSVILLWTTAAFGQEVGDRIVVTANYAYLKTRKDIVGCVPKGKSLMVRRIDGNWFWVNYSGERGMTEGWVNRRDVVPVELRGSILWHGH